MRRVAVFIAGAALAVTGCLPEPKSPLTRAAVAGPEDAIHKRQVAAVRALLEAGADSNTRHGGGSTPLMFAAPTGTWLSCATCSTTAPIPAPGGRTAWTRWRTRSAAARSSTSRTDRRWRPAVVRELLARAPDLDLRPAAGPGVKLAR